MEEISREEGYWGREKRIEEGGMGKMNGVGDIIINMTDKYHAWDGGGLVGEEAGADLSKSRVTLGSRTRFCFHYL